MLELARGVLPREAPMRSAMRRLLELLRILRNAVILAPRRQTGVGR
jgi:hypothetical protein